MKMQFLLGQEKSIQMETKFWQKGSYQVLVANHSYCTYYMLILGTVIIELVLN